MAGIPAGTACYGRGGQYCPPPAQGTPRDAVTVVGSPQEEGMARTHLPEAVGCFLRGRCRLVVGTRHGSRRCLGGQCGRWVALGQTPTSCTEGRRGGSHGGTSKGPPSLLPTALQDKPLVAGDGDRDRDGDVDGDGVHSSSGPQIPPVPTMCHPLGVIQAPPEVTVLGERITGSSTVGSSPAGDLAQAPRVPGERQDQGPCQGG